MLRLSSLPAKSRRRCQGWESEVRTDLPGRACRDRGAQAQPRPPQPPTPLPSPPGPDSTGDCREELLDTFSHGSLGRKPGGAAMCMAGHRGSALLLPPGQNFLVLAPPNLPVLIVSSSVGVSQEIWDCCTPWLHSFQVKSHRGVMPPGTAGVSCQKSSSRPGPGVWWAPQDWGSSLVQSSAKSMPSPSALVQGLRAIWGRHGWVGEYKSETTLVSLSLMLEPSL